MADNPFQIEGYKSMLSRGYIYWPPESKWVRYTRDKHTLAIADELIERLNVENKAKHVRFVEKTKHVIMTKRPKTDRKAKRASRSLKRKKTR